VLVMDRLTIHDKHRTSDGYLVTEARFARSGIYEYSGRDLGKPEMATVRVFRPETEVFNQDAMASFAHKPVTNDHPAGNVSAATWKKDAVGFTDGRVARDGDFVVIPMMIADASAISDVEDGKRELSAGYACDIEFIDGQAPDGSEYDAVMRNIRGNHIAVVDTGRAGPGCRIGDSFSQEQEQQMQLKLVLVDGIGVETNDAGERAIVKLQGDINALREDAKATKTTHDSALAAKDTELAAKDAEIADLKTKVLDAAALDKLVADRAKLVAQATKLVDKFDATGKDTATIKREVVTAKCGDAAAKDKSEAYIDARFDTLVEAIGDAGSDQLADALRNGAGGPAVVPGANMSVGDAQREMNTALDSANDLNGWRNKGGKAAAA
jgi:hypothetical protein